MTLKRVSILLFGCGVGLATLSAVIFGPIAAGTEMACPDHDPSYAIQAGELLRLSLKYTDGCNTFLLNPLFTAGVLSTVAGVAVGAAAVLREQIAGD